VAVFCGECMREYTGLLPGDEEYGVWLLRDGVCEGCGRKQMEGD